MSSDFWRLGMSAQMGQNCPTKAFFVAWSKLCFKYYVLWPVCHTYSTSQCLWMTWQWNSWNSHYFVFCSIVPISVSRISMLCHYIVGHCKNMRSKPILSLYWIFFQFGANKLALINFWGVWRSKGPSWASRRRSRLIKKSPE